MRTMIYNALPVVFIPATLCDGALYQDAIESLGSSIEPHILLSPKPTLDESVADILSRAPEKFALVGTSYGGNVAMRVALTAPERVLKLVLSGCDPNAPVPGGPDFAAGLKAAPDMVIDLLAGLVVKPEHTDAKAVFYQMAKRVGAEAGANQARAMASRQEVMSRLGTLSMPALVIQGEDDPLAPMAQSQALADALPNSAFRIIMGCGHLPPLEKPDEYTVLLQNFLGDH